MLNSCKHASLALCEQSYDSFSKASKASISPIEYLIENRGGFAHLAGLAMVPSQYICAGGEESARVITQAKEHFQRQGMRLESFSLAHKGDVLHGITVFPRGWIQGDTSKCLVFNNPNGIVTAELLQEGCDLLPKLLELKKCPIILYDYRGTGMNRDIISSSSLGFKATHLTVVQDGYAVLKSAARIFGQVENWGSSLGGGVATCALAKLVDKYPGYVGSTRLTNHDSFTNTARVVMPNHHKTADFLGWMLGGKLEAQKPMRSLVEKGVKVTVLCHDQDPVIPAGARMAEFVESMPLDGMGTRYHVEVIRSGEYGHANLSADMVARLMGD